MESKNIKNEELRKNLVRKNMSREGNCGGLEEKNPCENESKLCKAKGIAQRKREDGNCKTVNNG